MQQHQLPNGLTLYLQPNDGAPLVTLDAWVRVGSRDEPAELAGISHFLEHMLFKGTERLHTGEYDRRIEALGGYLNAATSADYTHYYVIVPSENLDAAAVDLADVLQNSVIDEAEVEKERQVILEEIRMKDDNPGGFLHDRVTRAMFASGPYAGTVIGSPQTVAALTRPQLREHFERHYAPENMAIVAVGNFDAERLRLRLEELLGGMRRRLRPWRDELPPTVFAPPASTELERDWQQAYFYLAFPGPALESLRQAAALSIAEAVLDGGRTSRLVNALVEKKRLATSISASFPGHREPSFAAISGTCQAGDAARVEEAAMEEVELLRRHGMRKGELARAKRQLLNAHLFAAETNTGQASMLGYSFALFGRPDFLVDYPAAIEAETEEEALAALDVLDPATMSRFVTTPRADARAPR